MCYITATELKTNLSYYMDLSHKEDVYVTKNGKVETVLTSPKDKALEKFLKLRGILKDLDQNGKSYEEMIAEGILQR